MLLELLTYILTFKICKYLKNIFPDGITEGKFAVGISQKIKHFSIANILQVYNIL